MTQQLLLDILPPSPQTLDNFIPGANGDVLHALRRCAPGRALYLWGPPGAGCTHLLRASCQDESSAAYFAPCHGSAIKELAMADTVPYRLLAVDSVHELDDKGQAALFSLYNRWRESAGRPDAFALIVAGNRAPLAMPLREDLRTRLGWDLSFRLQLLADDDRARALSARAQARGLKLAPEVLNWLLTHYTRDMRRLSSLIDALDRYSLERHRPLTLPLLKELLAQSERPNQES